MRLLLILLCITSSNFVYCQSDNVLTIAFSRNNGKALSSFFDKKVDLKLPDKKGIYTKQQAKLIMTEFFNKNSINNYEERHVGGGKEKANFHIGFFQSNNTKYRTYILYNLIQDKPQIIELRIESVE